MIFKTYYQYTDTSTFIHFIHIGIILKWTVQILYKVILINLCLFPNVLIWGWCSLECQGTKGSMGHLEMGQRPQNAHHCFRKYISTGSQILFYCLTLNFLKSLNKLHYLSAWCCCIFMLQRIYFFPHCSKPSLQIFCKSTIIKSQKKIKVERYTQFLHTLL